jgi:hypothetical protein
LAILNADPQALASVIEVTLKHDNPDDIYGRVKSGHIKLRGHFTTFSRSDLIAQPEMSYVYEVAIKGLASSDQFLWFETHPASFKWTVATLFLIACHAEEELGLILAPSPDGDPALYIRIGSFSGKF